MRIVAGYLLPAFLQELVRPRAQLVGMADHRQVVRDAGGFILPSVKRGIRPNQPVGDANQQDCFQHAKVVGREGRHGRSSQGRGSVEPFPL